MRVEILKFDGGFNPHPRSTAGVTMRAFPAAVIDQVSILTRDQLRVSLKVFASLGSFMSVSILTRDQLRVSPTGAIFPVGALMFQSSPAINCGCHLASIQRVKFLNSFNPHPRSTAGVTTASLDTDCRNYVSILTRDQLRVSLCAI